MSGIYDICLDPQSLIVAADAGVSGPGFLVLPPQNAPVLGIAPADLPVRTAATISVYDANRLAPCAKQFFRDMMAPTVKHV